MWQYGSVLREIFKLFKTRLISIYVIVSVVILISIRLIYYNSNIYVSHSLAKQSLTELLTRTDFSNVLEQKRVLLQACLNIGCNYLTVALRDKFYIYKLEKNEKDIYYLNLLGADEIEKIENFLEINTNLNINYNYKNFIFYKNKQEYNVVVMFILQHLELVLLTIWTMVYIYLGIMLIRFRNKERYINTKIAADNVQKELSESLHHEVTAPISVIRVVTEDLMSKISYAIEHSVETNLTKEECKKLKLEFDIVSKKLIKVFTAELESYKKDLSLINSTAERIQGIIGVLGYSKHIRSGDNFSINKILENFKNVKAIMETIKPIINIIPLKKNYYPIVPELNIVITNVLDTLVTNSLEAGATTINIATVQEVELKHNVAFLKIYLSDNGKGIRNTKGEIDESIDIFKYGFSTKDNKVRTFKTKVLEIFFGVNKEITNSRGIGLNLNRDIIRSFDGDLKLFKTSKTGTTFEIIIPVVEK